FGSRKKIGSISTVLDFGGDRLGLLVGERPMIVAGSWQNGVKVYDSESGSVLWSRPDMRQIQQVCDLSCKGAMRVGIGLDSESYHLLDSRTGNNISSFKAKKIYGSSFAPCYLLVTGTAVHFSTLRSAPIWRKSLISFAVLH